MTERRLWADVPEAERVTADDLRRCRGSSDQRWLDRQLALLVQPACPVAVYWPSWGKWHPCQQRVPSGATFCGTHAPGRNAPGSERALLSRARNALTRAFVISARVLRELSEDELLELRLLGKQQVGLIRYICETWPDEAIDDWLQGRISGVEKKESAAAKIARLNREFGIDPVEAADFALVVDDEETAETRG